MKRDSIMILGAGMAGYGAAYFLSSQQVPATIYEMRGSAGGHTASHCFEDGFVFDEGPHISFTKDTRIQEIFADAVGGHFERLQATVNNYWRGHWIKHPAITNLFGLPDDLVADCISDFMEASNEPDRPIEDYAQWLLANYGRTFASTFPFEYTRKYHTTHPENMATDWIGQRLYRPSLQEVQKGAQTAQTPDVHYVDHFRYPSNGGFGSYIYPLSNLAQLKLNYRAESIDPRQKAVRFSNGETVGYESLISSLPLPSLIRIIDDAPYEVVESAKLLACTNAVAVNIGVRQEDCGSAAWTYFYDEDITFTRLSFPHRFSPNTVPAGCSSVQAEVYYSDKYKPLTVAPEDLVEPVVADLVRTGVIDDPELIVHRSWISLPHANVIFDHDRIPALDKIHGYLREIGVEPAGRYGLWGYQWTDEAFISGEQAAERVLAAVV